MRKLTVFLANLLFISAGAQSYFGSASTPDDNGSNATSVVSVTPPGSMQAGDLVVMVAQMRNASASEIIVNTDGGQTWGDVGAVTNTNHGAKLYWARFKGNWDGDPSIFFPNAASTTVSIHVFRPSSGANTWAVDQAPASTAYNAPSSPFTVTQTGQTSVNDKVVAVSVLLSTDDNTWIEIPSDWEIVASAQYRNLGGNDISHVVGYRILATNGTATTDFSCRQSTNGGDNGNTAIVLFYEYTPTNRGFPVGIF